MFLNHRSTRMFAWMAEWSKPWRGGIEEDTGLNSTLGGSLSLQHLVPGQPVTNDQSNGFRSRNVMFGNKLIDASEHVGLEADHNQHPLSSWGWSAFP